MSKKVCVVTGSSSGIGAATARLFARNGYDVAVNFSRDEAPAQAVAAECRALGADVLVVKADVAQDGQCRAFAAAVESRWGRADVLVNNAGTTKFVDLRNLEGLSAEDFQRIYGVNVIGPFQMVRAFVPLLAAHPVASIVNVSSIAATQGIGSSLAYIASKGALNAMTVGLARALGPAIRVNGVAPGMVEGGWLKAGLGEERYQAVHRAYSARAALAAATTPEDIADAIYWLGDGARKMTGEVLLLDAGFKIGR